MVWTKRDEEKRIGMDQFLFERVKSGAVLFSPPIAGGLKIAVAKPHDSTPSAAFVREFIALDAVF